jgi:hypothetical protein
VWPDARNGRIAKEVGVGVASVYRILADAQRMAA